MVCGGGVIWGEVERRAKALGLVSESSFAAQSWGSERPGASSDGGREGWASRQTCEK